MWRIATKGVRIHGAKQLLRVDIVDVGQNKKLFGRKFMLGPFQAIEPTGGDPIGIVTRFFGKDATPFIDLSQR
jgi:hypothetical protein